MKFLFPYQFKKAGIIIAPTGVFFWLSMQFGYTMKVFAKLSAYTGVSLPNSTYQIINIIIAVISFFAFLFGLYFIAFSRERIEDEMVQKTRLDSFQFAALIQIIFSIIGFISILIFGDPNESGLLLFFISLLFLFWLSFIGRFNYILHIKLKQ